MTKRSPLKVRSSEAPNYPGARWSKKSVAWSSSSIIPSSPNIRNFVTQRVLPLNWHVQEVSTCAAWTIFSRPTPTKLRSEHQRDITSGALWAMCNWSRSTAPALAR
jgi:hypothetical protein